MLFTGMDHASSIRHPTRRTGANPVSPAARSNTRALGEVTIGSGSEMIPANCIYTGKQRQCSQLDLPEEGLECEPWQVNAPLLIISTRSSKPQ